MYHIPIMLEAAVGALNVKKDGLYFDGTLGGGGHSEEILKRGGRVIAVDRDADAIQSGTERLDKAGYKGRYILVKENFKNVKEVLGKVISGTSLLDGALLDLGISSHQIDTPERGMSYRFDGPLDMRMDTSQYLTAAMVINEYSEQELIRILFEYGEERFAKRIVKNIVAARLAKPVETTAELAEIIKNSVPFTPGSHPAKRTFQAIRIEVNNELRGLDTAINDIFTNLKNGGRLCVLTFHSLEDRIVKQAFKAFAAGCVCDKSLPECVCGHKSEGKLIAKLSADKKELDENPRSASATLRVIEKI